MGDGGDDRSGEVELGIDGLSGYRRIGSGGFATVYAALEEGTGRLVAVKVIDSVDDAGRRRFDRERRTMGLTTDHPNIVTMFRSGYTPVGDRPFLVLEHLDGGSLREQLDRHGPIPLDAAVAIVTDIADALRFAHSVGVVHKDVKPANILVSGSGRAKLTDFGIAAVKEATQASQIAYSIAYTAPESFTAARSDTGGSVQDPRDERSDLYSLAATLHALVTGGPPHWSSSHLATMRLILEEPPPTTGHIGLDRFLAVALAKNPDHRFQTAADFMAGLAGVESGAGSAAVEHAAGLPGQARGRVPVDGFDGDTPRAGPEAATLASSAPPPAFAADSIHPAEAADSGPRRRPLVVVGVLALAAFVAGGAAALFQGSGDEGGDAEASSTIDIVSDGSGPVEGNDEPDPAEVDDAASVGDVVFYTGHRDRAGDPDSDGVLAVTQLESGLLASAGGDGSVQIWDPADPEQPIVTYAEHDEAVLAVVSIADGRLASSSADGTVRIWDPQDPTAGSEVYTRYRELADDPGEDGIGALAALVDGRIASGGADGTVHVWDPTDVEAPPIIYTGHRDRAGDAGRDGVTAVVQLTSGLLASVGADGSAQIWDPTRADGPLEIFAIHDGDALTVAEITDDRLASGGADGTIRFWDPDRPEDAVVYRGHTDRVLAIILLPDGRIASSGADGTVQIWDPDEPTAQALSYTRHRDLAVDPDEDGVGGLAVLADGRIASASADGTVHVWAHS